MPSTGTTRAAVRAEEDEEEDSRSPSWVLVLVLVGLLAAIGVAYLLITRGEEPPPEPVEVEVPLHEGKDQNEARRSEEHTSELQSRGHLVCRLLLEKNTK